MQGIVQMVETTRAGGFPVATTPAGGTEIFFEDAGDFDETGGQVVIAEVELAYASADLELDVVTLAEPATFPITEDDFVAVHPHIEETWASIAFEDDIIDAEVPHYLKALLPDGVRDEGEGEAVTLEEVGTSWGLLDVVGQRPALDALFIENAEELLLENKQMLGERLAENDAAIESASGRLGVAEGRIDDAFGEIDLKPDGAYVDAAKQQAIDAAAVDAQTKADAARDAAITDAQEALTQAQTNLQQAILDGDAAAIADAEAKIATAKKAAIDAAAADATKKADAAREAAKTAAAADATAKAEAAEAAAAATAAADATAKANQAKADAEAAAKTYSDTVASGASQSAIDAAAADATAKADAAKQAAIDAAAADATAKAEAAEAAAAQTAAADATAKADAARDAAIAAAADDATEKADQAETNAKAYATTMTDGLAKGVESTALPGTTVMPKDSVWRVVDAQGNYSSVFVQQTAPQGNDWQARAITSEVIDNVDAGSLTVSGDTVLQDAVANTFAAKLANIIEANIGNLTVTGDTHLEDLVAQTIAGDTASFMSLTVDQILAGYLQAQWIITETGSIVAGDPTGARVEITSDGVRVYVVGPNGDPYEAVSMVNGEISFGVIGQDGTRLGGIDSSGGLSATTAAIRQDPKIKGSPLLGKRVGGGDQEGWLDALPGGLIGSTASHTTTAYRPAGQEAVYLRYRKRLQPNRTYRIVGYLTGSLGSNNGVLRANIRYRTDGAAASVSSTELWAPANTAPVYNSSVSLDARVESFYWVEVPTLVELVLTFRGINGSTARAVRGRMYIEDLGPRRLELGEGEDATPKMLYTSTWQATASRNYTKAGTTIAGQDGEINQWYWGGTPTNFRPAAWLYGGGAIEADDPLEMGKTLSQALTGANIERVEVYVRNKIWYGGIEHGRIVVGTLSSSTLPSTALIEGQQRIDDLGSGESARFDVPTSWFTNGANRGITMGDKDGVTALGGQGTVDLHSGQFHGPDDDDPPMLIVTYSR